MTTEAEADTLSETRQERFARLMAEPFPLPLGGGEAAPELAHGPAEAPTPAAEAPTPAAEASGGDAPPEPPAPEPVVEYVETAMAVSVPLAFPFRLDGELVAVVRLLPPSFGDVEAVLGGRMAEIEMIARMGNVPAAALRALRWPDVEKVTAVARHLMPASGDR